MLKEMIKEKGLDFIASLDKSTLGYRRKVKAFEEIKKLNGQSFFKRERIKTAVLSKVRKRLRVKSLAGS
jgi:hypothetical protein